MGKLFKAVGRFFRGIPGWLYRTFILRPLHFFQRIGKNTVARFVHWKKHPKAFLCGLRSLFIPGWGQLKNRHWYKAIPFFLFFVFVVGLELGTSNYFTAQADMDMYPIVTEAMVEGGLFYQAKRTEGAIVGGYRLTKADVADGGDYVTFRAAGDYIIIGSGYRILSETDVASGGTYFESLHMIGDVVPTATTIPYLLTADDVATGAYQNSLLEIGDVVMWKATAADVAEGGPLYGDYLEAGQIHAYTVKDYDLWAQGAYYLTDRQIGNIVKHVVTATDLLEGGLYFETDFAEGDIDYVLLTADNIVDYGGYLIGGDILGGVMLTEDSTDTYLQKGDIVWEAVNNSYRALTNANVNTVGATYYHVYRTAGTVISADGVTDPVLLTARNVCEQGRYYGVLGVTVGSIKKITLTEADVAEGGDFYQTLIAKDDQLFISIVETDILPNIVDLLIDQGVYRAVLGVKADNVTDRIYFFRDYGGWFTKGFWGLITLGQVATETKAGDPAWYRGWPVIVSRSISQANYPSWVEADNSRSMLTNGVIVLVATLIVAAIWFMNVKDAYRSKIAFDETGIVEKPKKFLRRVWDENFAYIIVLPTFLLIAFFTLIPFFFSFLTGFTSWDSRVSFPQELFEWEGLVSFNAIFSGQSNGIRYFGSVFTWTIVFAIFASLSCYVVGLIQALIIQSKYVVFKKFWRTVFILPWAIPSLVTLLMFRNIFSTQGGLANQVIMSIDNGGSSFITGMKSVLYFLGLYTEQAPGAFDTSYITWFGFLNYRLGRVLILLVNLWIGYPYFMLLITGTLTSIPSDMYEAADIDGASSFQKTKYITLPWILRATTPVIITTLTHNFNNFGVIYFLSGSVPNATYSFNALGEMVNVGVPNSAPSIYDILISWVYRLAMLTTVREFNLASVYSIIIFLMVGIFSIYNLSRVKSFWEED